MQPCSRRALRLRAHGRLSVTSKEHTRTCARGRAFKYANTCNTSAPSTRKGCHSSTMHDGAFSPICREISLHLHCKCGSCLRCSFFEHL